MYTPDTRFIDDVLGITGYDQTIGNFRAIFEKSKGNGLRRDLLPGTMQGYPIKGYGAIEIGEHRFCHTENGQPDCGTFKFAIVWKKTGDTRQAQRIISYEHENPLQPTDSLYQTIAGLDKQLFDAFNHQQPEIMGSLFFQTTGVLPGQ